MLELLSVTTTPPVPVPVPAVGMSGTYGCEARDVRCNATSSPDVSLPSIISVDEGDPRPEGPHNNREHAGDLFKRFFQSIPASSHTLNSQPLQPLQPLAMPSFGPQGECEDDPSLPATPSSYVVDMSDVGSDASGKKDFLDAAFSMAIQAPDAEKHTHCNCVKKCFQLFGSEADQRRLMEQRLNMDALAPKEKNDFIFNTVLALVKDSEGKVSSRAEWSLLGRRVCLDYFCFGIGSCKQKVSQTKELIANGHLSAPEPCKTRMPSIKDEAQIHAADAWWAEQWSNLAEPLALPEDRGESTLPAMHEAMIMPDHPLLTLGFHVGPPTPKTI